MAPPLTAQGRKVKSFECLKNCCSKERIYLNQGIKATRKERGFLPPLNEWVSTSSNTMRYMYFLRTNNYLIRYKKFFYSVEDAYRAAQKIIKLSEKEEALHRKKSHLMKFFGFTEDQLKDSIEILEIDTEQCNSYKKIFLEQPERGIYRKEEPKKRRNKDGVGLRVSCKDKGHLHRSG